MKALIIISVLLSLIISLSCDNLSDSNNEDTSIKTSKVIIKNEKKADTFTTEKGLKSSNYQWCLELRNDVGLYACKICLPYYARNGKIYTMPDDKDDIYLYYLYDADYYLDENQNFSLTITEWSMRNDIAEGSFTGTLYSKKINSYIDVEGTFESFFE